jgi:hypothetical protein
MHRYLALSLALLLVTVANLCHAQDAARVESFSPQGTIKNVRQVTARFSEPMTTFGDPRNESPFDITCPEKGSGRWADVKNWVFDFDRDLPAGVACSYTLRAGLKALAGGAVAGERTFSFTTGGPAIISARPGDGGRRWVPLPGRYNIALIDKSGTTHDSVSFVVRGDASLHGLH